MIPTGTVISVNVGAPRTVDWFGRRVKTAIWKSPVDGPVALQGVNFDGDDQADRRVHGGVAKSVYAYAIEDYWWWSDLLDEPLAPGTFGENLTLESIDLDNLLEFMQQDHRIYHQYAQDFGVYELTEITPALRSAMIHAA